MEGLVRSLTGAQIVTVATATLPAMIPEPQDTASPNAPTPSAELDDDAVLDQLEADLTAVEHAIATLDRVTADGEGGEAAASQIAVAVSAERFGVTPDGA